VRDDVIYRTIAQPPMPAAGPEQNKGKTVAIQDSPLIASRTLATTD
jgi:hypothetical protein